MKRQLRTVLALAILALTATAFIYYLSGHPETIDYIRQLPPATLLLILALYAVVFSALLIITYVSLRVYKKTMPAQENLLFNAYSSLINFFGPGQSGPAFRGIYLKKRHGLEIKKYLFITLLYYGFFAVLSAFLMFVGSRPWWQTALLMIGVGAASVFAIRRYKKRAKIGSEAGLSLKNYGLLFAAAALQVAATVAIYGVELHNIGITVSFGQILAYTGVANFALFVAITPGAIGIREAFLVFSEKLHHIDTSAIVAANTIDRAVYLVFLGLLFVLVVSLHAKRKLRVNQSSQEEA